MGSLREDEECSFFDAHDRISTMPGLNSYYTEIHHSDSGFHNTSVSSFQYDVWINSPPSVEERRSKFLHWMRSSLDRVSPENSVDAPCGGGEFERVVETSDAVLRTSGFEEVFSSSRSSMSCWSNDNFDLFGQSSSGDKFVCREGNEGALFDVDEVQQVEKASEGWEMNEEQLVTNKKSESPCLKSPSILPIRDNEVEKQNKLERTAKKVKNRWLSRLRSISCMVDTQVEDNRLRLDGDDSMLGTKVQRVKVHQKRKKTKELSALYKGQDIQAHEGTILTMKFSPNGQYLASAGEDGVVRVWQVVEDKRCNDLDIPEIDPSCMYFTVNHLSELKPLFVDKEKAGNLRSMRKTSDSACVIFPPKVFRILEKPLHEFHGHDGDILDLSWSKKNCLLSSSVDKTVRMWQVGSDHCLRVFAHSNYVTCVQFNPVDDNYFISGSIDGKVRIWAISSCQVVDWCDVRDIVTAVCYRPDGQGGIVGSMTGSCRFYNVADNRLQLDAHIYLTGKKRSPCRRITGLQFLPQDSSKVMVTCADSQVRILQGLNVICKYKGACNGGNQAFASLTPDGKHIVSACEDANVYVWNCVDQDEQSRPRAKDVRSFERFFANASIAIPWCGMKSENAENGRQFEVLNENLPDNFPFSSPSHFSLSHEYYIESFPKESATWPEETLPPSTVSSSMHKSQYKFLKSSCQNTFKSHAWGLVMVTAGLDGRIRSFLNYGLPVPV
ncbi:histone-lysine N-methyltransferase ATXR6-like [Hibiscus syriacus]|uniref:Histone-lysine N-methyltransferase ATXR6-like n=1 Tax=Hibiscus syriacus TaxID=106335 RepID=A0A6A3BS84_HIBSY|nr:WD repeat-containing protein 44-like [Hibiscus syriacus]KAE8719706.1 histone-lysine N-methyltransferase ATXR6-like [Hibiscus syriacus]